LEAGTIKLSWTLKLGMPRDNYLKETGTLPVLKVNWPLPDNLHDEDRSNYTDDPSGFGDTEDKNIDDWDSPAEPCK
jgi:hypothetical protein